MEWDRKQALNKSIDDEITMRLKSYDEIAKIEEEITALMAEEDALRAENEKASIERRKEAYKEGAILAVDTIATMANQISDAMLTKQTADLDKETAERKKNVENSKMSARQKAKELAKIDEDARKKRYEIALKDWRMNLIMSVVNTALAVTKTMATMGYPAGIPLAIAAGATGAISTGIIAGNKPEFAQGGFVPGVSYSGDKVDARVNSGEAVLNVQQQREFMALANGRTGASRGNITVGETTVIINGNATDETVQALRNENMNQQERILEMLYDAKDRGMIDTTRLTI